MAKQKIRQVTDEQIAQAFSGVSDTSVDQAVAERTGSDDKVGAGQAEASASTATAKPQQDMTPAAHQRYLELVKLGMRRTGAFGPRNEEPFQRNPRHNDFSLRRAYLADQAGDPNRQLDVADVDELFGLDESAPDHTTPTLVCDYCERPFDQPFVRAARVYWKNGSLMTNRDGSVDYRGQYTSLKSKATGQLVPVVAHLGDCLYKLRDANHEREKVEKNGAVYFKPVLLPALTYAGVLARIASIEEKVSTQHARQDSLGERFALKGRDEANTGESGKRYSSHIPTTPRG